MHSPAALAGRLAEAERPRNLLSARDGRILRIVAPNERLTAAELEQHLQKVLAEPHVLHQLLLLPFDSSPKTPANRRNRLSRHIAAWLRGCCYLSAGNSKQALRDARAAMAFFTHYATTSTTLAAEPAAVPHIQQQQQRQQHSKGCSWFPAVLLAGQAYAALGDSAQAVVHLAQAQVLQAPHSASKVVSAALQQSVRGLSPDQAYAWASGGLGALLQQLQDEAHLKLPEVLRPRPKWYYYNQWMKQRIHLALLELHLPHAATHTLCDTAGGYSLTNTDSNNNNSMYNHQRLLPTSTGTTTINPVAASVAPEISTSSARGRLLLELLAQADSAQQTPVVVAAAAAAGFQVASAASPHTTIPSYQHPTKLALPSTQQPAASKLVTANTAAETAAGDAAAPAAGGVMKQQEEEGLTTTTITTTTTMTSSSNSSSSFVQLADRQPAAAAAAAGSGGTAGRSSRMLQLPEPVVSKLLSMDAGDLDLMVQHPVALQAQVYELLDVLQAKGTEGLQQHPVQPLTWQEVQALAGPGTVGLPLGYTPTAAAALASSAGPLSIAAADTSPPLLPLPAAAGAAHALPGDAAAAAAQHSEQQGEKDEQQQQLVLSPAAAAAAAGGNPRGWCWPGWTRSQYVLGAAAVAAAAAAHASDTSA